MVFKFYLFHRVGQKGNLQRHLEKYHSDPSQHTQYCKRCAFTAPLRSMLRDHYRLVHGVAKQFRCMYCPYSTDDRNYLRQHIRVRHEKVNMQYFKKLC